MQLINSQKKAFYWTITTIGVLWTLFQLYTAALGVLPALQQRSVHLLFTLLLIFLIFPFNKKNKQLKEVFTTEKLVLALLSVWSVGYIALNGISIWEQTSEMTFYQEIICFTVVLLVLEAVRRVSSVSLPIIAIIFLGIAYFGNQLPGVLFNKGYSMVEILRYQVMGIEGIFGIALGVVATFVFLFIFYAAILQASGAGQLFIDLSTSLVGGVRGGPAKIAIIASCLFGTITGSAVANVAGVGTFTIPLMKKTGYSARFAGAVEAVASSGGQFMPPIMGSAAFLIAEVLSIPYWKVAIAAAIPAFLYYFALFIMVDLEAVKKGIRGLDKDEIPNLKETILKGWHLMLSPIILILLLFALQWSPMKAGFYAIVVTVITTFINPKNRITLSKIIESMRMGAMGSLETSIACASVGIVIGVIMQTGLGFALSSLLVSLSQGSLILLLILTMFASLVLGMGLPTVATYLVLSVMVAPALVKLAVLPLAAHLFIFYFGIISDITPPVALAAFVAAGISGDRPLTTGITACRLGLSAFILPYMFVYGPALIAQGTVLQIILTTISAVIGVYSLSLGLQKFCIRSLKVWESGLFIAYALLMIYPGIFTTAIGLMGFTITLLLIRSNHKQVFDRDQITTI